MYEYEMMYDTAGYKYVILVVHLLSTRVHQNLCHRVTVSKLQKAHGARASVFFLPGTRGKFASTRIIKLSWMQSQFPNGFLRR